MHKAPVTIVGFGDSITEAVIRTPDPENRWLNILSGQLSEAFPGRDFRVINAGVGGNSAREAMARFDKEVSGHHPDWVLLEFGGNNDDATNPERLVLPEEFRWHLDDFRRRLSSHTRVLVITFPPVIDEQHAWSSNPYYRQFGGIDASVERFRNITREFAAANGFPLVDLYRELKRRMTAKTRNRYTRTDGVHLTVAGNRLLAKMVFGAVRKLALPVA